MLTLSLTTLEILIFFIVIVAVLLLVISALLAPHRSDAEKESSYETGLLAILGQTRAPFTISYYVTAVLFLVFDLEVAFIFPSLITFNTLEIYGYWILTVFFIVLTFGFVLELGTGILDLTSGVTSLSSFAPHTKNEKSSLWPKV